MVRNCSFKINEMSGGVADSLCLPLISGYRIRQILRSGASIDLFSFPACVLVKGNF